MIHKKKFGPLVISALLITVLLSNVYPMPLSAQEEKPATPPQAPKKWSRGGGASWSIQLIGAIVLDGQRYIQDAESEFQVGDLSTYEKAEIRATRFGLIGTIGSDRPWTWMIAA